MHDEYALDRRANALYDAAMSEQAAAFQANEDGRYADENKHWQLYAQLMHELDDVHAEIRARNLAQYPNVEATKALPRMRKSEIARINEIKALLQREGEMRTGKIVNELNCSRSATNVSLKLLEIWGVTERSIRGVWRLKDESA